MAAGDITTISIETETNGMPYAQMTFLGMATLGTFAFGMGTNNDPSAAKVVFTVTRAGYDTAGSVTSVVDTVYGTKVMRKAYPNDAVDDVVTSGSDVVVHVALSDFIYTGDTVTVAIASGLYTKTGVPTNAVAALTSVTNNSVNTYPKPIGRFVTVPYQRVTGNFVVEYHGAHRSARNGKPLACVIFTATDAHSHTSTTTVTTMTLSAANYSGIRLPVYSATINVSTFTDGDAITVNAKAYPWAGNQTLDSTAGVDGYTAPDERLSPQAYLLDAGAALPPLYAVVDSALGSGSGVASTTLATAEATRCDTIATAKTKIAAIRATGENAFIYLVDNAGTGYAFAGSSTAFTGTPRVWTTIAPHPTLGTQAGCPISSGNNTSCNGYLRFFGLSLTNASTGAITGTAATTLFWIDSCLVNLTGASVGIYKFLVGYATDNSVTAITAGFNTFSTNRSAWKLLRGNACTSAVISGHLYCCVANTGLAGAFLSSANGSAIAPSENAIFAYNKLANTSVTSVFSDIAKTTSVVVTHISNSAGGATSVTLKCAAGTVGIKAGDAIMYPSQHRTRYVVTANVTLTTSGVSTSITPGLTGAVDGSGTPVAVDAAYYRGLLFACNSLRRTTTGGSHFIGISADNSTAAHDNVLFWHNVIATSSGTSTDARGNFAYNSLLAIWSSRENWSIVGNDFTAFFNKDDTFNPGAGDTPNGVRTGAWTVGYMLGGMSNVFQTNGFGNTDGTEFAGLNSKDAPQTAAYTNLSTGDLTPTSGSPSRSMIAAGRAVLPFDLAANAFSNSGGGTAGPFQYTADSANRRRRALIAMAA